MPRSPRAYADDIVLRWSHGEVRISPIAAMLRSARLRTARGWVMPFAAAPWDRDDPGVAGLPGHLRVLGGEFVCLPFGSAPLPSDAPPDWLAAGGGAPTPTQSHPHGAAADREWDVVERDTSGVTLALELPEPDPVRRLERTIAGVDGEPTVEFSLRIHARRAHRTPLGLHPVFRLPQPGETLSIDADFRQGRTYPALIDGGSGLIPRDTTFSHLTQVGGVDLSTTPYAERAEEVVQLLDVTPPVRLRWSGGDGVTLDWQRDVLPSVLLWWSDRQLTDAPWGGRFRGLGVEPIASAFDLPADVSIADNPIARGGVATTVTLSPRHPLQVDYRISAF
ncbi:hypothetical protein [Microbacterium sp. NPDC058389]|uniref:hypothetical protein n=1 Tax=Microbacterium sp. NPDC058389 TaxID=3346475 RepID=UPI003658D443